MECGSPIRTHPKGQTSIVDALKSMAARVRPGLRHHRDTACRVRVLVHRMALTTLVQPSEKQSSGTGYRGVVAIRSTQQPRSTAPVCLHVLAFRRDAVFGHTTRIPRALLRRSLCRSRRVDQLSMLPIRPSRSTGVPTARPPTQPFRRSRRRGPKDRRSQWFIIHLQMSAYSGNRHIPTIIAG
jgi:hypothetical protein